MTAPQPEQGRELREILNEFATDTETDLDAKLAYTEHEIEELIAGRCVEARIDEADRACQVMRNHSDDIVMAQRVVLDRIAALTGKQEAGAE
jgi:hypothetical protein